MREWGVCMCGGGTQLIDHSHKTMISFYCLSPSGSSPELYISLSTAGEQVGKVHRVTAWWCGGQETTGFILPHYPTLFQLASGAALVPRWGGEAAEYAGLSWASSGVHLPQLCFQLKGQNDMTMLVLERNGNEMVQWGEAMKTWSCQCCSHCTQV